MSSAAEPETLSETAVPLSARLRASTRDAHARAEAAMMRFLRAAEIPAVGRSARVPTAESPTAASPAAGNPSAGDRPVPGRSAYAALLTRLWRIYRGHEAALRVGVARFGGPPELDSRWRTPALRADLRALGVDAPVESPRPEDSHANQSLGGLVGSLYVTEGAALGGQILVDRIPRVFGPAVADACCFFRGNGERTRHLWMSFCNWADAIPAAEHANAEIAALAVFDRFAENLVAGGPTANRRVAETDRARGSIERGSLATETD